jgi:hypothetical protein
MSKLQNLLALQQHRMVGNTTFMLTGVQFNMRAYLLFASTSHAIHAMEALIRQQDIDLHFVDRTQMRIGKVHFSTINLLNDANYGRLWGMPVQVDHHALRLLVEDEQKRIIAHMEKKYGRTK